MLTENFFLEERELGFSPKVYVISPGVIDTDMQTEIRSSDPVNFSSHRNFVSLKEKGELFSTDEAANILLDLLKQPYREELFIDLRNI